MELQRLVWFGDIDLGVIVIEMQLWGRVPSLRGDMECVERRGPKPNPRFFGEK